MADEEYTLIKRESTSFVSQRGMETAHVETGAGYLIISLKKWKCNAEGIWTSTQRTGYMGLKLVNKAHFTALCHENTAVDIRFTEIIRPPPKNPECWIFPLGDPCDI